MNTGDTQSWQFSPQARLKEITPHELVSFLSWANPKPEDVGDILINLIRRIAELEATVERHAAAIRKGGGKS
jgi:hypothetical protein